jgi:hypothetical protein
VYDRFARLSESVNERGLAHVWISNDRDLHGVATVARLAVAFR